MGVRLRDFLWNLQTHTATRPGAQFYLYTHNNRAIHLGLPCWGPSPHIVSYDEGDADIEYLSHTPNAIDLTIEDTLSNSPFKMRPHDAIFCVRESQMSWETFSTYAAGGRYRDLAKRVKEAIFKRTGMTEQEHGNQGRYSVEGRRAACIRSLLSHRGALFMPAEIMETTEKVEIMAMLMFFREEARVNGDSYSPGLTANRSRSFANTLVSATGAGPETSYIFDNLPGWLGTHRKGPSGHLGWNDDISLIDLLEIVFPDPLDGTSGDRFEWPTVHDAFDARREAGDYYLDSCEGAFLGDGEWSDDNMVVTEFGTPLNTNREQPAHILQKIPGFPEMVAAAHKIHPTYFDKYFDNSAFTRLATLEMLNQTPLGKMLTFNKLAIRKLKELAA